MFCSDGRRVPTREWARVKDGRIVAIVSQQATDAAPIPAKDERIVGVTGAGACVGFMVDDRGNVTPSERRSGPIAAGVPAYVDGPAVKPLTTAARAESIGAAMSKKPRDEEMELVKGKPEVAEDKAGGKTDDSTEK